MSVSKLDMFWRSLILTKFFTKGWGKPDNLKRLFIWRKQLGNREACSKMVESDYPITIDKEYRDGDCRVLEGHFLSPFVHQLPGIMPKEVETASFQMILPLQWRHQNLKPVCIHLAGTGDHYFWRRRMMTAKPLLKETGIASILVENPYYGTRKPKEQLRSGLLNVSDLFVMGGALVLESLALLHWCNRQGWGPLGLSGVSMGGHMASLAATNWTQPISLVPCLSWSTASQVFTQGVLTGSIPWATLQQQFFEDASYQRDLRRLIVSPEKNRNERGYYSLGKDFVKLYSLNGEAKSSATDVTKSTQTSQPPTSFTFESKTTSARDSVEHLSHDIFSKDNLSNNFESQDLSSSEAKSTGSIDKSKETLKTTSISSFQNVSDSLNDSSHSGLKSVSMSSSQKDTKSSKRSTSKPLSLNYAQSKAKMSKPTEKSSRLTLKHSLSKSKLATAVDMDPESLKNLKDEAFEFMKGVMDECTHLGNFSVPVDPELIIIVAARQDAYIPRNGVLSLDAIWPGSEVRYVDDGHVGAVLWHQPVFRKAIVDSFNRQLQKHFPDKSEKIYAS